MPCLRERRRQELQRGQDLIVPLWARLHAVLGRIARSSDTMPSPPCTRKRPSIYGRQRHSGNPLLSCIEKWPRCTPRLATSSLRGVTRDWKNSAAEWTRCGSTDWKKPMQRWTKPLRCCPTTPPHGFILLRHVGFWTAQSGQKTPIHDALSSIRTTVGRCAGFDTCRRRLVNDSAGRTCYCGASTMTSTSSTTISPWSLDGLFTSFIPR